MCNTMNIVHLNVQIMLRQQLAPQIKSRRLALGMSQMRLSQLASVSRTTLSRLEGGVDTPIQTDVLERILGALALSPRLDCAPMPDTARPDVEKQLARLREQIRMQELREKHWRLALDLATRPREMKRHVIAARAQVALWAQNRTCSPHYIHRWSEILNLPLPAMAREMTTLGEWTNAMFQNTPWSGAWN